MSNEIGKKITSSRKDKKLTQTDLANLLNVSLQTIHRWENGSTEPDVNKIARIAEVTQKPIEYFFNELIERKKFEIKKFTDEKMPVQKVPLISWVLANHFGEVSDPFPPGGAEDWLYTTAKGKHMFALKIKSDCMEPEFREGDRIIVDPDLQPENGNYVVVRDTKENEATFKQLKVYGKKIILHPLNPKYQDIELESDKRYVIVGKVVGKDKKY